MEPTTTQVSQALFAYIFQGHARQGAIYRADAEAQLAAAEAKARQKAADLADYRAGLRALLPEVVHPHVSALIAEPADMTWDHIVTIAVPSLAPIRVEIYGHDGVSFSNDRPFLVPKPEVSSPVDEEFGLPVAYEVTWTFEHCFRYRDLDLALAQADTMAARFGLKEAEAAQLTLEAQAKRAEAVAQREQQRAELAARQEDTTAPAEPPAPSLAEQFVDLIRQIVREEIDAE